MQENELLLKQGLCDMVSRPQFYRGVVLHLLCLAGTNAAADWPQWRGPQGKGISDETGLPLHWNESTGLKWKTALPEWGTSTPTIQGEALFLTCHTEKGKLLVLRLHSQTGQIEWTRQIGVGEGVFGGRPQRGIQVFHRWHNMASPSPVVTENRVVVQFGTGDMAALDFAGNILWQRNLQQDHGPFTIWWGFASSSVLNADRVITCCMQDSLADRREKPVGSYVVAHDLETGREVWKTARTTQADAEQCDAYTTPLLLDLNGRRQLVIMGANQLDGYDPATGKQLWFLPGLTGGRTVPSPTADGGLLYAVRGLRGALICVQADGQGQLSADRIVWQHRQNTPDTCCPIVYQGLLFTVSDEGIAQCLDAKTGKLQWRKRIKGPFKASPVAAEGRVYFVSTTGVCTVLAAARELRELAVNPLDDQLIASPALSAGTLFLRGRKGLYAIAAGDSSVSPDR